MRKLFCCVALPVCTTAAHAGSVRLFNDTAFPLIAEVHSADGKVLGKKDVDARQTVTWEGAWSGSAVSETPYTVRWLCKVGGKVFSTCTFVGAGAMAAAGECPGEKNCPQKKNAQQ